MSMFFPWSTLEVQADKAQADDPQTDVAESVDDKLDEEESVDWAAIVEDGFKLVGRESALIPADAAPQSQPSTAAAPAASKGLQVERHWEKLLYSNYQLSDSYIFDDLPFCTRPMTHEFSLSTIEGEFIASIDQTDQDAIIAAFVKAMCRWGIHEATPVITFKGCMMQITCSTQSILAAVWKILQSQTNLYRYRIEPACKGLPFVPRFWLLEGVPANADKTRVAKGIQSYADRNQRYLGQLRTAYASFYRVVRPGSKAIFSGNVLLVTDAVTIRAKCPGVMPGHHEARPRRIYKPLKLM